MDKSDTIMAQDDDDDALPERLGTEIELLQAMYPGQIEWKAVSREVKFVQNESSKILLRVPDTYPESGLPTVISATGDLKQDMRQHVTEFMSSSQLSEGEEVLDAIILAFQDILAAQIAEQGVLDHKTNDANENAENKHKAVIIWLHHLLATTKRKLALNPTTTSNRPSMNISGLTKPGYPGIMIFSGAISIVNAHVTELKSQRWQAFQVRFEEEYSEEDAWKFEHGEGIKEVESMSEITQGIVDHGKREMFLSAVGVK